MIITTSTATTLLSSVTLGIASSIPLQSRSFPPRYSGLSFNYCPAASWPTYGPGYRIEPQTPSEELQQALSEIDHNNIENYITKLVSFGTRATLSTQTDPNRGIGAARDWIAETMRGFAAKSDGHMVVTVPGYTQEPDGARITFPVLISNVEATIRGPETPDRYYVVSGHYDSRVTNVTDYTSDAPGADDDASGVALSLELARVMATRRPKSTLVFTAVTGEEQGLYGAYFQAETFRNNSINVAGMFDSDIIGSSTGDDGYRDPFSMRVFCQGVPPIQFEDEAKRTIRLTVGGENDSPARELGRFIVEVAQNAWTGMKNVAVIYRLDRFLRGGDHSAYINTGYLDAVRFTEPNENFAHQHQDVRVENGTQYGDLIKFVDFEYIARVSRVKLAALWSLSEAPAVPTNVFVNTTALNNDSTFIWSPVADPNVAGYELVYRPTNAPFWTNAIFVGTGVIQGPNRTATVNLSKDNMIFGLRTVGTNGLKSPAVFALFPL